MMGIAETFVAAPHQSGDHKGGCYETYSTVGFVDEIEKSLQACIGSRELPCGYKDSNQLYSLTKLAAEGSSAPL